MIDPVVLPASVLQSNGDPSVVALLFAGGILRGVLTFVGSGFVGVVLMAVFQMWADDVVRNAREEWAMRTFVGIAGSAALGFVGIFLLSLSGSVPFFPSRYFSSSSLQVCWDSHSAPLPRLDASWVELIPTTAG